MKKSAKNKKMTIDDLAVAMQAGFKRADKNHESLARMVARGFEDVTSRMALKSETATKQDIQNLQTRMDKLEHQMGALNSSVNNYLRLSDERYLELKNNQKVLAKYLHMVVKERRPQANLKDLESILK